MKQIRFAVLIAFFFTALVVHAQKSELAVTVGAAISPDAKGFQTCGEAIICTIPPNTIGPVAVGFGFAWQASFGYRLANFKAAALYLDLPVVSSPSRTGPGSFPNNAEFSSIFFTPSAQFKFLPGSGISPFASVGGGLAHFGSGPSGASTGALQLGGGVDFRTPLRVLGVRAEVRDFITGRPDMPAFGQFTSSHFQHIFAGGGIVLKF